MKEKERGEWEKKLGHFFRSHIFPPVEFRVDIFHEVSRVKGSE